MRDILNKDGKLVCQVDDDTGTVVIVRRGKTTKLRLNADGTVGIENE